MIVLEEWRYGRYDERLIVGRTGHIRAQWRAQFGRCWQAWDDYTPLPLFNANAQRKTRKAKC